MIAKALSATIFLPKKNWLEEENSTRHMWAKILLYFKRDLVYLPSMLLFKLCFSVIDCFSPGIEIIGFGRGAIYIISKNQLQKKRETFKSCEELFPKF